MPKIDKFIPSGEQFRPAHLGEKRISGREKKTEVTARDALTGSGEIPITPELRMQRRMTVREAFHGLMNAISRLFARMIPERFSNRERQSPVPNRESAKIEDVVQNQLSEEEIAELNNQLLSIIQRMERFHFEPIGADRSEVEIEKLENKDQEIKDVQDAIIATGNFIESLQLPTNDPLKIRANEFMTLLKSKLVEARSYFSALEGKYGDKTARLIEKLKQNNDFKAQFDNIVENLLSNRPLDEKLADFVTVIRPIIIEFLGKTNPGADEITLVLEAGFQQLKETGPDRFNELEATLRDAEHLPEIAGDFDHPNVTLNQKLDMLQEVFKFLNNGS